MLTYVGRGYTPAFAASMDRIVARLSGGETLVLVEGPDEICRPYQDEPGAHCRFGRVSRRDRDAAASVGNLLGLHLRTGTTITLDADRLARMRSAFARGDTRRACWGCEWADLCTGIVTAGFAGAQLATPELAKPGLGLQPDRAP